MADFHNNKPKRKKVCFMCIGKDVNYKKIMNKQLIQY